MKITLHDKDIREVSISESMTHFIPCISVYQSRNTPSGASDADVYDVLQYIDTSLRHYHNVHEQVSLPITVSVRKNDTVLGLKWTFSFYNVDGGNGIWVDPDYVTTYEPTYTFISWDAVERQAFLDKCITLVRYARKLKRTFPHYVRKPIFISNDS